MIVSNNVTQFGGTLLLKHHSDVSTYENSKVSFNGIHALSQGGTVYSENYSNISFGGTSFVSFYNSKTEYRVVILSVKYFNILPVKDSTVIFKNHHVPISGG